MPYKKIFATEILRTAGAKNRITIWLNEKYQKDPNVGDVVYQNTGDVCSVGKIYYISEMNLRTYPREFFILCDGIKNIEMINKNNVIYMSPHWFM